MAISQLNYIHKIRQQVGFGPQALTLSIYIFFEIMEEIYESGLHVAAKENPANNGFHTQKLGIGHSWYWEVPYSFQAPMLLCLYCHTWCIWLSPSWSQGGCCTSTHHVLPISRQEDRKDIKEQGKGFSPHDHLHLFFDDNLPQGLF